MPHRPSNISRRSFMQSGLAAGAAGILSAKATGAEQSLKPVRIGVVGVGSRGTFLLRTLLQFPGVEIPAVCDIEPDHAQRAAQIVEDKSGKAPQQYTAGERDFERLVERDDLDAVVTATSWEWHVPVMISAMQAGKYAATEVPAAITLEGCWDLVRTSEDTGQPCMMLENVCYSEEALAVLRMVRESLFGDMLHCEVGYQHDTRYLKFDEQGHLTWRGKHAMQRDGNQYPTHPLGPAAWWLNIHRGDRFDYLVSMSSPSAGPRLHAQEKLGPDHALAQRNWAQGDVSTTLIKTVLGKTITLYYDCGTPRPYDSIYRVQGTKGIYMGNMDSIYIEGRSPKAHQWEASGPYVKEYRHPLWERHGAEALEHGGHGGADYVMCQAFVEAVRNNAPPPIDVYDAAAWSAIVPLSIESVVKGSQPVPIPDFTGGNWKQD